ncbi:nitroreductase family protein [Herbiconiux sp. VKM Ac-2851]|uniref:nitroreductase family protein n=1 Tax=Herbiconiux sp. VKM Ac-2851 TaxID=2739025 RepID=UPI001564D4D0|nr:nitroreductase family protein [Herbiconiux sp. VKM Ac-2851]NQX34913.1 nitroreductase family protein [Herbiconiux sp. VKM Ac-2851]
MTLTDTAPRPAFDRAASTSAPILPTLADRWSPRSFDAAKPIDETVLTAALEAARWAPSAANSQPARFIVARRGTPEFDAVASSLLGFNSVWAGSAAVLIVAVAEVVDAEGKPRRWAEYDLGQAMAHLSVQAHHDGLHVHQMGGFDVAALTEAFSLPASLVPLTITALGHLASADALPDDALRARETAPRTRLPLADLLLPTP